MITLFENKTNNGSGNVSKFLAELRTVVVEGTWDGAAVDIEVSIDGTNFYAVENGRFTQSAAKNVVLGGTVYIRGTLVNAGASTNLTARVA